MVDSCFILEMLAFKYGPFRPIQALFGLFLVNIGQNQCHHIQYWYHHSLSKIFQKFSLYRLVYKTYRKYLKFDYWRLTRVRSKQNLKVKSKKEQVSIHSVYPMTSKTPSAMMNISRATSPLRQIMSPGVNIYARILSTRSCKNSG